MFLKPSFLGKRGGNVGLLWILASLRMLFGAGEGWWGGGGIRREGNKEGGVKRGFYYTTILKSIPKYSNIPRCCIFLFILKNR